MTQHLNLSCELHSFIAMKSFIKLKPFCCIKRKCTSVSSFIFSFGTELLSFVSPVRNWQNWDSSGWRMSLLHLGPAFSPAVSSSIATMQQSPALHSKVNPFCWSPLKFFQVLVIKKCWSRWTVKINKLIRLYLKLLKCARRQEGRDDFKGILYYQATLFPQQPSALFSL